MKIITASLLLLLSLSSFANSETMTLTINNKKTIKTLISKGEETGEIYSSTMTILGIVKKQSWVVIRINDNLKCFTPDPETSAPSLLNAVGLPYQKSWCEATIDTSAD